MRRTATFFAATAAVALLAASAAVAGPEEDKKEQEGKDAKFAEQIDGLTKAIESLRDKPADTVASGGGEIEGALLSSYAIKGAAAQIVGKSGEGQFLVAAADDVISTDKWRLFQAAYAGKCAELTGSLDCSRPVPPEKPKKPITTSGGGDMGGGDMGGNPLAVATAVLPFLSSLLRSETEISNLGGAFTESKLLARAVVAAANGKEGHFYTLYAVPHDSGDITTSPPYAMLTTLMKRRGELAAYKKPTDAHKATLKSVDEFIASVTAADKEGSVPLIDIIRAERLSTMITNRSILTVALEKAGGTMLKRKGIDVALGAPSVRASGGVIVSYTIETPESTGRAITASGIVACATRLTELKRVHLLASDFKPNCR